MADTELENGAYGWDAAYTDIQNGASNQISMGSKYQ